MCGNLNEGCNSVKSQSQGRGLGHKVPAMVNGLVSPQEWIHCHKSGFVMKEGWKTHLYLSGNFYIVVVNG